MSKETKAMEKLAEAMTNLADRLERFQDPVMWQKIFSDAMSLGALPRPSAVAIGPSVPIGMIEGVTVRLSEEDRDAMAQRVFEAIQPQLEEFSDFLKDSLKDMPAHRLRELAAKIDEGKAPKLQRRPGCIYITFETGEGYYLGL